jgi:hypothetical protein
MEHAEDTEQGELVLIGIAEGMSIFPSDLLKKTHDISGYVFR